MTKEMGFCNNGNKRKRNGGTSAADLSSFPALFLEQVAMTCRLAGFEPHVPVARGFVAQEEEISLPLSLSVAGAGQ
jgi:hypothetical protein